MPGSPLAALRWRYAVKRYDLAQPIGPAELATLREAIQLAPSSQGLQPYRVLFITDPALRARLREASYGQTPVTEAAQLVVFAAETRVDAAYVDAHFAHLGRVRGVPLEGALLQHKQSVLAWVGRLAAADKLAWATHQAYLALGVLVLAAAELGLDANPMEGFEADRYDELLDLPAQGLRAVVLAGLGHRHPADPYQHLPKVRRPATELFAFH